MRVNIFLVAVLALICSNAVLAVEPDAPEHVISREQAASVTLQAKLAGKSKDARKADYAALAEFYRAKGSSLVWVDAQGLNKQAKRAMDVISRAGEFGLDASAYELPGADSLAKHRGYPAEGMAEAELKLSLAVLAYARHAQGGRISPAGLSSSLDYKPNTPDPLKVLNGVAQGGATPAAFLEAFHPRHPQFLALKRLLAQERGERREGAELEERSERRAPPAAAARPGIPDGPSLRPGERHPHVALVRRRLRIPPRDGSRAAEEYYDRRLADAVWAFQKLNGLPAKAIIDAETREALNNPAGAADGENGRRSAESRATGRRARPASGGPNRAIILANMERWRWLPRELGETHVRLNIPEFLVRVHKRGEMIHEERAVVGKPENPTPAFSDEIQTIVFNPYWNVPPSIAFKEILPAVRRNPEFLAKHRLEVHWAGRRGPVDPNSVDWDYVDPNKLSLRQPPGHNNALGNIKFVFPNRHSVYMHDTPTKSLFNQTVRAHSHGCMRLRNPQKLAEILLAAQGWTAARVQDAIDNGYDQSVGLARKVPVHITYFTAWADENGQLKTFRDIYGHDEPLMAALRNPTVAQREPREAREPKAQQAVKQRKPKRKSEQNPFDFLWN